MVSPGNRRRCVRAKPGLEAHLAAFIAGELRRPLAAPTHGGNYTALSALQVEEGQHLVGRTPPARLETALLPGFQHRGLRCKIVKGSHSAFGPVQRGFAAGWHRQNVIQRLDVLQERSVGGSVVGQRHHPLHRRKVGEALGLHPQFKPGARVEIDHVAAGRMLARRALLRLPGPVAEQLGAAGPVILKREPKRVAFPGQGVQRNEGAILQQYSRLRPQRLVPAPPIPAVFDPNFKLARACQRHVQRQRAILAPANRRGKHLLAAHQHMEGDRAVALGLAPPGIVVILEADVRRETPGRFAQVHQDVFRGIEGQPVGIGLLPKLERGAAPRMPPRYSIRHILVKQLEERAGPGLATSGEHAVRPVLTGEEFFGLRRNRSGGREQAGQSQDKQRLEGVAHKVIL